MTRPALPLVGVAVLPSSCEGEVPSLRQVDPDRATPAVTPDDRPQPPASLPDVVIADVRIEPAPAAIAGNRFSTAS
jgi:hypothetical protein